MTITKTKALALVTFACLSLGGCATQKELRTVRSAPAGIDLAGLPVAVTDVQGVERRLFRDGRVLIGGQPNAAALERLKELGVTAVVNLRTPREMDNRELVPFDEAAEVARIGMEYVSIPIGGPEFPYVPETVARFAEVLDRHSGSVFLHCASGGRVSYLWAAYLIRFGGLDLGLAYARGRAIGIAPDPVELMLGRPLTVAWAEAAAAAKTAPTRPH